MRCQQFILWTHLPGFGSSALLLGNPVSRHTGKFANLFQMSIVFLIGYGREDARIFFIRSFRIFRKYSQGFVCQSKSLAMISLFGYNIEYITVYIRPSQRNNIRESETCITCKYKDTPLSVYGFSACLPHISKTLYLSKSRVTKNVLLLSKHKRFFYHHFVIFLWLCHLIRI